ncbi:MAG: NAD(P)/FAD-dependent oxidoreductase [Candidatus Bathyarchaeota archaeon]|nr:NAD(P)/FAD-dependent oxidoreductase [Candidatus Bathyarchaeota archaeon]
MVGGGPAGATAAYYLAKAGKSVILIDRQTFPRDKVCGDFVSQIAIAELEKMGITQLPEFQDTNVINSASVFVDGKELASATMPLLAELSQPGRVIPRKTLDNWILDAAKKAGVTVLENVLVTDFVVENNQVRVIAQDKEGVNHIFHSRLLIGADGSNSLISRIMHGNLPPQTNRIIGLRGYFEDVKGPFDRADMHFSSKNFPGYCWLFPTGQNQANVGIGVVLETMPKEDNPKELLDQLIHQDEGVKQRLADAKLKGPIQSWPINVYNPHREITSERVMLVGEAAGLVNPLNGEGIQYALLSGKWAAQTALKCKETEDYNRTALFEYAKKVRDELDFGFKLSSLLIQLTRNRNLNPLWLATFEVMLSRAKTDPEYAKLTGGILSGITPATDGLNAKFVISTIESAVASTKQKIIKDPASLPKDAVKFTQTTLKVAQDTAHDPVGFIEWGISTALQAAEFAATIPMRALRAYAKEKTSQ